MFDKTKNTFGKIKQLFKIKELRTKIIVVLLIFVIYRMMANIPVPGIDASQLKEFLGQFQIFGLVNAFTGGSLQNMSIVMLGLGPYITATVILQILSMIFPALERLYKEEGEEGKDRFNQYGRLLTVPLALFNSYGMLNLLQGQNVIGKLSSLTFVSSIVTISAGTVFLVWLSEIIDERGIGSGSSLIIFAGIISSFPQNFLQIYAEITSGAINPTSYIIFAIFSLFMIFSVVFITQAKRNIPISYAKRVRGRKMYGGAKTYLPMNINPAGVMPIIFALSLLTFPSMIANFFVGSEGMMGDIAQKVSAFFETPLTYSLFYFILVFLFTFFYTMVIFDPYNVADNLKVSGGFVPGHRPGEPTAEYLNYTLNRILPIGALFLAVIALAPTLIGNITGVQTFQFLVGGTSLLIMVNVIIQTYEEINSYLQMREL